MQYRTLGEQGARVSALGLGCMGMSGGPGSRTPATEAEGIATIEAALDAGITLLNTGDFYAMGHNELLIGQALRRRPDAAFLSVKFGAQRSPSGAFLGFDGRPNSVKNFAAYSLQRLGVDVIDLYQPGRVDPEVPIEDTVGAIAELIAEGKVRFLGLSEATTEHLIRAHRTHPITALEIEYSLASRFIEADILPTARQFGIGIIAYNVVAQGLLTSAITGDLAVDDPRRRLPRFQGDNLTKNLNTVTVLREIATARDATAAQVAIAWVLSRGDDVVPLVGMSRRSRLIENLAATDLVLTEDELTNLELTFTPGAIVGDRLPAEVRHLSPRQGVTPSNSAN
jgi:aryl-alcohol dehydrogenase-like predicted oxidoreductase